ncbi:tripartite motif-containing protein 16-like [Engraulis encrasicolus]|uniref:tripartite motif-containing protein 16-like n=1 Tax=Engraulis encrasicolus TaxID=184585 RepID=UPI002FD5EA50
MAEAAVEDQDPFHCSVCLGPLRDPATIPCGHSYCMSCISGCWDQEDQKGEYSCPQCRETFSPRPVLRKSTMLAELVDKMRKSTQTASPPPPALYAEPGDVECDLCTEIKLKAVKSCLVCLLSLCQTHIEPHYNTPALKKHKLVRARHLQQKICSQHNRLIEVFCRTDQKWICMLCTMDEHKGHDTVPAAAERKEREKEIGKTGTEFQQRIQKREKEQQMIQEAVASYQHSAQEAEQHSEKIFTELLQSIERRRSEVRELIRAQQKAAVKDAEDVLEELEQELAELRRGHAELDKLSSEEDHVHVLQSFKVLKASVSETSPSISLNPDMSFKDLSTSLSALKREVDNLFKQDVMKISTDVARLEIIIHKEPKTREDFLKYSCNMTFDPNTAHSQITLSEGNKRATSGEKQCYPDHPERFTCFPQVLSKQGFCRHAYWEVELDQKNISEVEIAAVYKSIGTLQVVLLELTVPWEDRMEEAQERKRAKYADLVAECRRNGWIARCEPIEVGCRGFAGRSLHRVLGLLGIHGLHRRRATKNILEAAEKASRWLWLRRGEAWRSALPGHKSGN